MKSKFLLPGGALVLVALCLIWLLPPSSPSSVSETTPDPQIAEHPDYFQQWFEMKKDENGEIPSGLYTEWYQHDLQQAANLQGRIGAAPFDATNFIGPNTVGGRTRALMIDRSNENRIFAGCISGGLWRTTDGGSNWSALNDAASSLAVSCITQSPLNSNIIYYGTGESRANSSGVPGDGIFKSTDGGNTFNQLSSTIGISQMDYCWAIQHSKTNANTVYVGTNTGGLYRTTNGGTSWSQVYSGGSVNDIITFDNGGVMFSRRSSGIYYSPTGNSGTFTQVTDPDFPTSGFYRIEIEEYKANDDIIYAAFEQTSGGCQAFLKSTDGGTNWDLVATPNIGQTYTYYCFNVGISANNPNRITCAGVSLRYSTNGGTSWSNASTSHADHHSMAPYSGNPDELLIGNDGGVFRFNWNSMNTFTDLNDGYHTTQFYAGDFAPTGTITIGGTQDNGTHRVGDNYRKVRGGDGAYCHISQQNGAIAYSSYQNGSMSRSTNFTATAPSFTGINTNTTMNNEDYAFINAYQINYADGDQLYCRTNQGLWRTVDRGASWSKLSGSITGLFAIGCTPEANPTVYFGGSSAKFYRVDNAATAGSGSEVDLSASVPSTVTNDYLASITPRPGDNTTLYIGFSNFTNNPRAWKVTNANTASPTWTNISGDLPTRLPVNYIQADPDDPDNALFAGTDFGLYYSTNGGTNWIKEPSVPSVSIHETKLRQTDRTLFLFTHGRGIWELPLSGGAAPPCGTVTSSFPYTESFESGLGAWEQDGGDDIDWTRDSGGTPSGSTGPSSASDGTWYMYVEASSPNFPSKVANLDACFNFLSLTNPSISFDYHMYGSNMGTLNLQASTDGGTSWTTVWTKSGDQTNTWNSETVDLSAYGGNPNVKLRWNGTTGNSFRSDMTIDNIFIGEPFCESIVSSFPYEEGFESGTGAWTQEGGDDFDWTRDSGGTTSSSTGPTSGANGSTWYMYTESSSPNHPGKRAFMKACFDFSGLSAPSMDFSYHMYGATMGTLKLQATTNRGATWADVWSLSGDQGNAWNSANVDLSAYALQGEVGLRWFGLTSTSFTSDMTIDDISITNSGAGGSGCQALNFNNYNIDSYGGSQDGGTAAIQDGGATLFIQNNAWKSIAYPYTVTANTYVQFDFRSTIEGEIHGVGFDNDNSISNNLTFKVHGTQNWGFTNYDNYSGTSFTSYVINVGAFYTGTYDRVTFVADHDGGAKNGNGYFRDITISEGPCNAPAAQPGDLFPTLGDEEEPAAGSLTQVYPNPFSETVRVDLNSSLDAPATVAVYDATGKLVFSARGLAPGQSLTLPGTGLASGVYLLQVTSGDHSENFRLMKR